MQVDGHGTPQRPTLAEGGFAGSFDNGPTFGAGGAAGASRRPQSGVAAWLHDVATCYPLAAYAVDV